MLPSGNLNIDFKTAVACVRSAFVSNLEMISGSIGHLQVKNQLKSLSYHTKANKFLKRPLTLCYR